MWEMYDELIAGIPEDLTVKRYVAGNFWTVVESELGVGTAGTPKAFSRPPVARFDITGATIKKVAALSKSWNMIEAAIGVASINAYYNTPEIALQTVMEKMEGKDVSIFVCPDSGDQIYYFD